MLGGAFEAWDILRGPRFQAGDCNNKSVNLFRSRSQVTSSLAVVKLRLLGLAPPGQFDFLRREVDSELGKKRV